MKKQKYSKPIHKPIKEIKKIEKPFSWWKLSVKILVLLSLILSVVIFTDKKGYFTADQTNNHIVRKWASFYDYTRKKEVDVIILGNSHVITGVEPYVLSVATSSTCYILGNAGAGIIDTWFHLEEALKYTKPKLVIIETYCINNAEKPKENTTPYFQSFDAHKNKFYKLQCMPKLFYSDSWVAAWSSSIRNHSFLLTEITTLKNNIKNPQELEFEKLDLGRFARFKYGLQDSTLKKYDSLGAPVKGKDYEMSSFTKKYLHKIMKMCEKKEIPVLFLTAPMYYKHVADYDSWKSTLYEELKKYLTAKWFDLQMPYDTAMYTPEMFEDTYDVNQHLSNLGMIITAYKLAEFININYPNLLPDRSKDPKWINDFKTIDDFAYNQYIAEGMEGFSSIVKDKQIRNFYIKELVMQEKAENNRYILKIEKQDNLPNKLDVQYDITFQGKKFITTFTMYSLKSIFPPNHKVYFAIIKKEVKINELINIIN